MFIPWILSWTVDVVVFYYMDVNTIKTEPVKKQEWVTRKGIKNKIRTRIKQAKVLADITINDKPLAVAMRDNGYKAGYSPAKLQKTKTWAELLARDLPDKLLSKTAKYGLKFKNGDKVKEAEIRHKYLETSLKMTGKLRQDDAPAGLVGLVVGFKMIQPKDTAEVIEGETIDSQ